MARRLWVAVPVFLAGCAVPGVEGEPGYVLLDEASRRAGVSLEHADGQRASVVRPVAVGSESTGVFLTDSTGDARPLAVGPSSVVVVRGASGAIMRLRLGDARPDVLIARAPAPDALALAQTLEADLSTSADGATFELLGPEVWERAAALADDPFGVIELLPSVDGAPPGVLAPPAVAVAAEPVAGALVPSLEVIGVAGPVAGAISAPDEHDPFGGVAPSGTRFARAEPGHYAMQMRDSHSGGCSRSWSNTTALAAISLDLSHDGRATACRAKQSQTLTRSMDQGEDGLMRSSGYSSTERERHGYRGAWTREGDVIALVLRRDDTVCGGPVQERGQAAPETWRLRCAAVRERAGEVSLPGAGLACTVAADPWTENLGYTIRSLDNATGHWMLLGADRGWEVRSHGGRFSYAAGVEVTAARARVDVPSAVDPGRLLESYALPSE